MTVLSSLRWCPDYASESIPSTCQEDVELYSLEALDRGVIFVKTCSHFLHPALLTVPLGFKALALAPRLVNNAFVPSPPGQNANPMAAELRGQNGFLEMGRWGGHLKGTVMLLMLG